MPAAEVRLQRLDQLWFQVAGTLCNLSCSHCFISCSPTNRSFGLLDVATVEQQLAESVRLGVREYYFTGGEPFLHREIVDILEAALRLGPTTVLTNGMLLCRGETLPRLRQAQDASRYSLEFRVSIDHPTPSGNDAIRGAGSFAKSLEGLAALCEHGFLPIVTCMRSWEMDEDEEVLSDFRELLSGIGCTRPRLKVLPSLKLGAEVERTHGYAATEEVTEAMLAAIDPATLICSSARVVTDRGVWVCPILLDEPAGRLGENLTEASSGSFPLAHGACTTCWAYGSICANPASATRQGE